MLTLEKFEEASEVVKQVTTPTKLVYSEYLSAQTGARIYLKPEILSGLFLSSIPVPVQSETASYPDC